MGHSALASSRFRRGAIVPTNGEGENQAAKSYWRACPYRAKPLRLRATPPTTARTWSVRRHTRRAAIARQTSHGGLSTISECLSSFFMGGYEAPRVAKSALNPAVAQLLMLAGIVIVSFSAIIVKVRGGGTT